jgi:hypothetical protein
MEQKSVCKNRRQTMAQAGKSTKGRMLRSGGIMKQTQNEMRMTPTNKNLKFAP